MNHGINFFLLSIYQILLCYLSIFFTRQVACTNYFALTPKLNETNEGPLNPMKHWSDSIGWEMAKKFTTLCLIQETKDAFLRNHNSFPF
jgi:hypothetical protein